MLKKLLATLFIAMSLVTLLVSAGLPAAASEQISTTAHGPDASQTSVSLNESSNGMTVSLSVGDTLTVNLQSQPSTGFSWHVDQINAVILQTASNQFVPPDPPVIGGIGTEVWVFRAVAPGTSPLVMKYARSNGEVGRIFALTVNVTPATPTIPASSALATGLLVAGLAAILAFFILKKPRMSKV